MKTINGASIPYKFDEDRVRVPAHLRGKQCFVYLEGETLNEARELFGRPNAVLKIFFNPLEKVKLAPLQAGIENYYWGSAWRVYSQDRTEEIGRISKLVEATAVQNFCWIEDLAPRVYGLLLIERNGKHYPAQLTEYVEGDIAKDAEDVKARLEKIENYLKAFACKIAHKELVARNDFIGGKLIDFQGFRFTDKTESKIKEFIRENGKYGKGVYQSCPELGLKGVPRDTLTRIKDMKLDEIDFKGKTVLDIGCNIGQFCNYAVGRGAKRIWAYDVPEIIRVANVLAFYLGNHNNEYIGADLTEIDERIIEVADWDIVFYLSMLVHTSYPKWLPKITKELLIIEENAKGSNFKPEYWKKELAKDFSKVEQVGVSTDKHRGKPIYWCWK